jgi:hypothetical protein
MFSFVQGRKNLISRAAAALLPPGGLQEEFSLVRVWTSESAGHLKLEPALLTVSIKKNETCRRTHRVYSGLLDCSPR